MAVLRDLFRLRVFEPFARRKLTRDAQRTKGPPGSTAKVHANGTSSLSQQKLTVKERKKLEHAVIRFSEQGWTFVYAMTVWAYGLWLHLSLPTDALHPEALWTDYPHELLAAPVKLYYILEFAFYCHQILILNAEAPRKDHVQMMTHHIITVLLISASYICNATRAGCLILVLMDFCDFILPAAKMLKYLGYSAAADVAFGAFLLSWLITRHFLFSFAIISTCYDLPKIVNMVWQPEKGLYMSVSVWRGFCFLLIVLQVIQIIWFVTIARVAYQVLRGGNADDARSDIEDGSDEVEIKKEQ